MIEKAETDSALPISIMGVPFDAVTTEGAIAQIEAMITSRQEHYLVTANVDFLVQARGDVELRRILMEADLVLCDGTPLLWASKLLGNRLPERVAGADLVPKLIEKAAQKDYKVFLLGATENSCEGAAQKLREKLPGLKVSYYSPPFRKLLEMDHDEILRRVHEAQPDLLFVCFGCPKQEKWIAMHYRSLKVPVTVGVGATIDFLAGQVRRAPAWMQRTGTEWLFRLAQEPRRLARRYAKDLVIFGTCMGRDLLQFSPFSGERQTLSLDIREDDSLVSMRLPEHLDRDTAALVASHLGTRLDKHLALDAASVQTIDCTALGLLSKLHRNLRQTGHELVLVASSQNLLRALETMGLRDFFLMATTLEAARRTLQHRPRMFRARRQQVDGITVIWWQGELTAAQAKEAWSTTLSLLPGTGRVILDLGDLSFIDSSGLSLMVRARKISGQNGITVEFRALQQTVRNVVRLAGLEKFLLGDSKPRTLPNQPPPLQPSPCVSASQPA